MLLFAMAFTVTTHAQPPPSPQAAEPELQGEQFTRYQAMTHELRCLVCQNETIGDSTAPLADDLRKQVQRQIATGKTDKEIISYLTARYGDYVLYRPPFKASTALLWLGPFVLLLLALFAAWRFMRRTATTVAAPRVSEAEVQRVLALTQAALANQDAPPAPRP